MATGFLCLTEQEEGFMVKTLIQKWSKHDSKTKHQSILHDWLSKPKLEEEISICEQLEKTHEKKMVTLSTKYAKLYETKLGLNRTFEAKLSCEQTDEEKIQHEWDEVIKSIDRELLELQCEIDEHKHKCDELTDQRFHLEVKLDEINKQVSLYLE